MHSMNLQHRHDSPGLTNPRGDPPQGATGQLGQPTAKNPALWDQIMALRLLQKFIYEA
jgi:hypothetical protein